MNMKTACTSRSWHSLLVAAILPATAALAQNATLDITDMQFDEIQKSIRLSITNPLSQSVQVEVFYKDSPDGLAITNTTGWLAATNAPMTMSAGQNTRFNHAVNAMAVTKTRYYVVGRTDVDTDGDALSDAREMLVYGTDDRNPDSDGDGVNDGAEVAAGTNPKGAVGTVFVVDGANGNDINNGTSLPKRTIAAALLAAAPGDTVVVEAGTYVGKIVVPNGVRLLTRGKVIIL